jgi:putative holliday junction resolvase
MGKDETLKSTKPPIYLGFDLGSKSLGIAIRNRLGMIIPLPAWFFPRLDETQLTKFMLRLIEEHQPTALVFGIPYHADGRESNQTTWVQGVVGRLSATMAIPIFSVDERFTTIEAKERLHEFGLPEKKQKDYIDSVAACIILEQYERQPR